MAFPPSRYERTRCIRRGWVFERVGWIALAIALFAAVAGLFGGGGLSDGEARAGDRLSVTYPRFLRAHSPFELAVDWLPRQQGASLWISRAFLDDFEVAEIQPMPSAVTASGDRIYYMFAVSEPSGRVGVTFRLKSERGGELRGRIGSGDDLDVEIRQFAFP